MTGYSRWKDIRAAHVKRAGGEAAVANGKQELLATVQGHASVDVRADVARSGLVGEQFVTDP